MAAIFSGFFDAAPVSAKAGRPGGQTAAGSTLLAAPHVTVPQEHWTYDAMTQVAQRGVETGVPDNTFSGKRLLTRADFARALHIMAGDARLVRQLGTWLERMDVTALRKLCQEFGPELAAEGVDLQVLRNALAELAEVVLDDRVPGFEFPFPSGPSAQQYRKAAFAPPQHRERGATRAAAEWKQGLVVLYSLDPIPETGEAFSRAISWVKLPNELGAAEYAVGHNTEVWRRLREFGPPAGASVSWLGELFDLKGTWNRRRRARLPFDGETLAAPHFQGTVPVVLKRSRPPWHCTARPYTHLSAQFAGVTVELRAPQGLWGGWSSYAGVEVLWGPPGSGVVYLRNRREGKKRIHAYDLRTGWLLNTAEG